MLKHLLPRLFSPTDPLTAPGPPTACNPDTGTCYWAHDIKQTWEVTRTYCHARGLVMFSPTTEAQWDWFRTEIG